LSQETSVESKPGLNRARRIAVGLLLLLALSRYLVVGLTEVEANYNSAAGDQNAYLQLGLDMIEQGRLTNGVTHPLYPALTIPFAHREWSYFTLAKLTSLAIGLLSLVVTFLVARRLANGEIAALVVALLGANPVYLQTAALVNCEILLAVLFLLAWYYMAAGFANRSRWPLAGLLCGLAYLTKGSGQLLVVAFLLTAVVVYRRRIFQQRAVIYFLAVYLLAASVLYVYNYRTYGNPLYNRVTTHEMWLDNWEDNYVADESLPTASTYLRSHTLAEMVNRQQKGMRWVWSIFSRMMVPLEEEAAQGVLLVVAAAGALAFWLQTRRPAGEMDAAAWARVIAALLLLLLLYLSAAWFALVFTADRFIFPLMALLYVFVAELLWRAGAVLISGERARTLISGVFLALALAVAAWLAVSGLSYVGRLSGDPFRSDRQLNEPADRLLSHIWEGEPGGAGVIWGPSRTLPAWKFSDRLAVRWIPANLHQPQEALGWLRTTGAKYFIIDEKVFKRRSDLLSPFFYTQGMDRDMVGFHYYPDDWALFDAEPGLPCLWCTFRLLGVVPIAHPRQADFERGIRLAGYELDRADAGPGDLLHLTLYWQATEKIGQDYTIFAHLLGPDGRIWGQMDGQPLWGRWPTDAWITEGEGLVADRHTVPVDPAAPQGEYRFSVGLYLPGSGERLKLVGSGLDALLLETKVMIRAERSAVGNQPQADD
jgi:hypothetical protein